MIRATVLRLSVLLALMGLPLAACGGGAASPTPTPVPGLVVVEFKATELSFAPKTADIPLGRRIRLVLTNDGQIEHDLTIDVLGVHMTVVAGASDEVTLGPIAAGTYRRDV